MPTLWGVVTVSVDVLASIEFRLSVLSRVAPVMLKRWSERWETTVLQKETDRHSLWRELVQSQDFRRRDTSDKKKKPQTWFTVEIYKPTDVNSQLSGVKSKKRFAEIKISCTYHIALRGQTNCCGQRNLIKTLNKHEGWSHWNKHRLMPNPITTTPHSPDDALNNALLQTSPGREHGKMPASIHSVDSNQFIYLYNVCYCL